MKEINIAGKINRPSSPLFFRLSVSGSDERTIPRDQIRANREPNLGIFFPLLPRNISIIHGMDKSVRLNSYYSLFRESDKGISLVSLRMATVSFEALDPYPPRRGYVPCRLVKV